MHGLCEEISEQGNGRMSILRLPISTRACMTNRLKQTREQSRSIEVCSGLLQSLVLPTKDGRSQHRDCDAKEVTEVDPTILCGLLFSRRDLFRERQYEEARSVSKFLKIYPYFLRFTFFWPSPMLPKKNLTKPLQN